MNTFSDGISGFSGALFDQVSTLNCDNHLLLTADQHLCITKVDGQLSQKLISGVGRQPSCGDRLDDVFPALTGLFPLDEEFVELPNVQLNGHYVTLYLLSEGQSTWLLALDTTESSLKKQAQQQEVLNGLFNGPEFAPHFEAKNSKPVLDCAVLQCSSVNKFKPVGAAADWLPILMSSESDGFWKITEKSPITACLPMFVNHWKTTSADAIASDWIRLECNGHLVRVRAKAMTVSNRPLLILSSFN